MPYSHGVIMSCHGIRTESCAELSVSLRPVPETLRLLSVDFAVIADCDAVRCVCLRFSAQRNAYIPTSLGVRSLCET